MRISDHILPVVLFAAGFGLASAFAFDGTRTPGDIAPAVGEALPRGSAGAAAAAGALHAPNPLLGSSDLVGGVPVGDAGAARR